MLTPMNWEAYWAAQEPDCILVQQNRATGWANIARGLTFHEAMSIGETGWPTQLNGGLNRNFWIYFADSTATREYERLRGAS